jgi:hypothetical protein
MYSKGFQWQLQERFGFFVNFFLSDEAPVPAPRCVLLYILRRYAACRRTGY